MAAIGVTVALWDEIEDRARLEIEKAVASRLDATLEIGALDLDLLRLRVEAADVDFEFRTEGADPLTAHVDRAVVTLARHGLSTFLGRRIHLSHVEVDGARLETTRAFFDARKRLRKKKRRKPLDLRVDELIVRNGQFGFEDRRIPVDVAARDIGVQAEWAAYRQAMVGELTFTSDLAIRQLRDRLPVTVQTSFRLTESRFVAINATATGPGVTVRLRRHAVTWGDGSGVSASGSFEADLDVLNGWFTDRIPTIGGHARGEIDWSFTGGPVQVRGNVVGDDVRFDRLQVDRIQADASIERGKVWIDVHEAVGYGGTIAGRVAVHTKERNALDLDLRGSGVSAHRILGLMDLPFPLQAAADVDLRFRGVATDRSTWNGDATFGMVPFFEPGPGLPVEGEGSVRIEDGRMFLDATARDLASADLAISMAYDLTDPHGVLRLRGPTRNAEDSRQGTARVLGALGQAVPEWLDRPLLGHGEVDVRLDLQDPFGMGVDLSLHDGAWGEDRFDDLALTLEFAGDSLDISHLDISTDGWRATGEARMDLSTATLTHANLDARDVPLGFLLHQLGNDLEVGGRVSAGLSLTDGIDGVTGAGKARIDDLTYLGERIERLEGAFVAEDDILQFRDVVVEGEAIRGLLDLDYSLGDLSTAVRLQDADVDLGALGLVRRNAWPVDGRVAVRGDLRFDDAGALGMLNLSRGRIDWQGEPLADLEGTVWIEPDGLWMEIGAPQETPWAMTGSLGWDPGIPCDLELRLERFRRDLVDNPDAPPAWGRVSGQSRIVGLLAEPQGLAASGSISDLELRLGARRLRSSGAIVFHLAEQRLKVEDVTLSGRGSDIVGAVELDLTSGELDGSVTGRADLGVVAGMFPDLSTSGEVDIDLAIAGTLDEPELFGTMAARGGRARFVGFTQPFEAIEADLTLRGQEAEITRLRAILGGGELTGVGGVQYDGLGLGAYYLELDAANVGLRFPSGFHGVYEGRVDLRGDPGAAEVGGDLKMLRGLYTQDFDVARLTRLGGRTRAYTGTVGEVSLPFRVFLDLDVHADDAIWVRNDLAELETDLDLDIGGEVQQPRIAGRIRLREGGTLRYRDVKYEIRRGTLDFVDPEGKINPYMNIRAETEVREFRVLLRIEGTLDDFDFELTSNPSLSTPDIIALLTTGTTLQELSTGRGSGGLDFTGDVAANYFAGALTARFEDDLKQIFGVEQLTISPGLTQNATDPTARLTVGKRVHEDVLLLYSIDLGQTEQQFYQVEWRANRRYRLTAERDVTGGIGGEVVYTDRYWLKNPPPGYGTLGAVEDDDAPRPTVGVVRVEGIPESIRADIAGKLPLRPGGTFRRSALFEGLERLRARLVKHGYLGAVVDAEVIPSGAEPPTVDVTYAVDSGVRYEVVLEGMGGRGQKRLRKRLKTFWAESTFVGDLFEESTEIIREHLHDRGNYACDVEVFETIPESPEGTAQVRFLIDPGPEVRVREIRIEGHSGMPEDRIRRQILSQGKWNPATLRDDAIAVRRLYLDHGYLDVDVLPPRITLTADSTEADVALLIVEGPQYTVGEVVAESTGEFTEDELTDWTGLRAGEVYSTARILSAEASLRAALDRRGHPDARIETAGEPLPDNRIRAVFIASPGPLRRVGEIVVEGNFLTRRRIIDRELELAEGDLISRENILKTQHNLNRLGTFRNVRIEYEPMAGDDPTRNRLTVRVEEARPISARVGLGYNTEIGPKVSMALVHSNLGGRDHELTLQGFYSSREKRALLAFEEPRLFARNYPSIASLFYEDVDRGAFSFKRRSLSLRVENSFRPKWNAFLRYNFQNVDLFGFRGEEIPEVGDEKLSDTQLGDIEYTLTWENFDNVFAPSQGQAATFNVRFFAPVFLSEESFVKLFARYGWTHTFKNRINVGVLARIGLEGKFGDTVLVPVSERFFAGGDSTIRGFVRDGVNPLGGEGMFILNLEGRVPIWSQLYGVLFFDTGNVWLRARDFDLGDMREVVGTGLRLQTPIGPLRLEYGHKLDRRPEESAGEWFLTIGSIF